MINYNEIAGIGVEGKASYVSSSSMISRAHSRRRRFSSQSPTTTPTNKPATTPTAISPTDELLVTTTWGGVAAANLTVGTAFAFTCLRTSSSVKHGRFVFDLISSIAPLCIFENSSLLCSASFFDCFSNSLSSDTSSSNFSNGSLRFMLVRSRTLWLIGLKFGSLIPWHDAIAFVRLQNFPSRQSPQIQRQLFISTFPPSWQSASIRLHLFDPTSGRTN